jgi:hypothetical protein
MLPDGGINQRLAAVDGLAVLVAGGVDPGTAVAVADSIAVALFDLVRGNSGPLAMVPQVSRVPDDGRDGLSPPLPARRGLDPFVVQPSGDLVQRPAVDTVLEDQRNVLAPRIGWDQVAIVLVPCGRVTERETAYKLAHSPQSGEFPGHPLDDVLAFLVGTLSGDSPQRAVTVVGPVEPLLDHVELLVVLLSPLAQPGQVEVPTRQPRHVIGDDPVILEEPHRVSEPQPQLWTLRRPAGGSGGWRR